VHLFIGYGMCDVEHGVIGWLGTLRYMLSHLLDLGRWTIGLGFHRHGHDGTLMGRKLILWIVHPDLNQPLDGGCCTWFGLEKT
jgi:hypothetical protein